MKDGYLFINIYISGDGTTSTFAPTTPNPTRPPSETPYPTSDQPTTAEPTTVEPTTAEPTTAEPTTNEPTTKAPTSNISTITSTMMDEIGSTMMSAVMEGSTTEMEGDNDGEDEVDTTNGVERSAFVLFVTYFVCLLVTVCLMY